MTGARADLEDSTVRPKTAEVDEVGDQQRRIGRPNAVVKFSHGVEGRAQLGLLCGHLFSMPAVILTPAADRAAISGEDPLSDVVDVANRRRFPGQEVCLLNPLGLVGLSQ